MSLIEEYRLNHRHPFNRATHMIGIPTIVVSLPLMLFEWHWGLILFALGWCIQFLGHIVEGSWPAFFKKPIHLLTGPYWWLRKMLGRA